MPGAVFELARLLRENPYPGRGIVMGLCPGGRQAVLAYFIMGRSQNSRNRVFEREGNELRIRLHAREAAGDPALILYRPSATVGDNYILTNGDQTDTLLSALRAGGSFRQALESRTFEPDAPHFTPRISGMMTLPPEGGCCIRMSLLRAADAAGTACDRLDFAYPGTHGQGRFLHTYRGDGNPLPSFTGEPLTVGIPADEERFADDVWDSLNADNRVALCVRTLDLKTRESRFYLRNRHPAGKEGADD